VTQDSVLVGLVALVWIVLAALYAFVPMFAMPGAAFVWGSGAVVFLVLSAATATVELRRRR
jgi:hypothetical protein